MKASYETPKLIVHGTVEQMTQFWGSSSATDAIYIGTYGPIEIGTIGSRDLIIPWPPGH